MPQTRPITPPPNLLSDPAFDRAAIRRTDHAWVAAVQRSPEARVAPLWRSKPLVVAADGGSRAAMLPADAFDWSSAAEVVFLGVDRQIALFAADVSPLEPEAAAERFESHGAFEDLRAVSLLLSPQHAALLAYARGMLWWHERHRFCGVCGHPTRSNDAGHRRLCVNESCKTEQFPRSDPAVIVLVEHEGRCLLARGARFPEGFRSVLAGFVEPGESLEDTVAREVFEECGVRVTDIAYSSSQPWPFPSSLMLGFRARALDDALTLDLHEILEAGWFSRDFIRTLGPGGPFRLPPRSSIARRLLDDWVAEV
jgi:NAD+ diphosphatase